jgi:hypothetical protein
MIDLEAIQHRAQLAHGLFTGPIREGQHEAGRTVVFEDVPALVAEVERLRDELAKVPQFREIKPGTPEWKAFAEKHHAQPPTWEKLTDE